MSTLFHFQTTTIFRLILVVTVSIVKTWNCNCSGHGAMAENYYLDDGTYSASQIVIALVQRALEVTCRRVL